MSFLAAFGVYALADLVLSAAVLYVARKKLPLIRHTLKSFLSVPSPCNHTCVTDMKDEMYRDHMGFRKDHTL